MLVYIGTDLFSLKIFSQLFVLKLNVLFLYSFTYFKVHMT